MKISKILPVAALGIALSVGATQKAEAYAYAYSDLYVSGGSITILGPTGTALTDFEAGETNATGPAGYFDTPNGTTTSTSTATLDGGSGGSKSDNTDALVSVGDGSSFPGGTPVNNIWTLQTASTTDSYTWADSEVISEQTLKTSDATNPPVIGDAARYKPDGSPDFASTIETHQIAEGNVTDATLGTSGSSTTSSTEFTATAHVGAGGAVMYFDFDAVLAMFAEITAPHTGVLAIADSNITISITDENATPGAPNVFTWVVGFDANGGTVVDSAYVLSNAVSTNTQGDDAFSGTGHFAAYTDVLAAGTYKVRLTTSVSESVQAQTIPAPDTLALFGLGVVALGLRQRRSKLKLAA